MSDAFDWQRLAAAVLARRDALGLSHYGVRAAGGPSPATLSKIEHGNTESITNETKRRLERSLAWTKGSVDQVLAGGEPGVALPSGSGGRAEVLDESQGERLLIDIVNGASELSDERRREILALIHAMQDRDTGQ